MKFSMKHCYCTMARDYDLEKEKKPSQSLETDNGQFVLFILQ